MNISVGGIKNKIIAKADWAAFILGAWERYGDEGGLKRLFDHYTNFGKYGWLDQTLQTLGDPELLKYKLWDSPHGYTGMFKAGVFAYIATELGILDKKWKKPIEKLLKGSGAAAITLGGSGPNSKADRPSDSSRNLGSDNPMLGVYNK